MPKEPFHRTFPQVINRLQTPAAARIVQLIGECTEFPHEGIDTLNAWGAAMVRLGLAKNAGDANNPHDFIPEERGKHRKPFHEVLLFVTPRIQNEVELEFVRTLVNETEIPEPGRAAFTQVWQTQLETLGHIHGLQAADFPIYFGEVPQKAALNQAA